jgi:hypothetical protein
MRQRFDDRYFTYPLSARTKCDGGISRLRNQQGHPRRSYLGISRHISGQGLVAQSERLPSDAAVGQSSRDSLSTTRYCSWFCSNRLDEAQVLGLGAHCHHHCHPTRWRRRESCPAGAFKRSTWRRWLPVRFCIGCCVRQRELHFKARDQG